MAIPPPTIVPARPSTSPHDGPRSAPRSFTLRILVHDFAGHPFQVQLSRELAGRGHEVSHLYCASLEGGQGDLASGSDLDVVPVQARQVIDKSSRLQRLRDEVGYGKRLRTAILERQPDVVISANTPPHAEAFVQGLGTTANPPTVLWLQDLYGEGVKNVSSRQSAAVGAAVSYPFVQLERRMVRNADHVVVISDDFVPFVEEMGTRSGVTVIRNWAPLDEIAPRPKANPWTVAHGLDTVTTLGYVGTLGMKHDPQLVLDLAVGLGDDAAVVVVASGTGMDWLRSLPAEDLPSNLRLFDPVPYETLPDVLGGTDVAIVLLEPDAGSFSVPSKVLSYLAAGRPVLGAMPTENLATRTIEEAKAGLVSRPGDSAAFVANGRSMAGDPEARTSMGSNARSYAEEHFRIETITDRFEEILERVVSR